MIQTNQICIQIKDTQIFFSGFVSNEVGIPIRLGIPPQISINLPSWYLVGIFSTEKVSFNAYFVVNQTFRKTQNNDLIVFDKQKFMSGEIFTFVGTPTELKEKNKDFFSIINQILIENMQKTMKL